MVSPSQLESILWSVALLVNRSSDLSCTGGMIHNKILLITPGWPRLNIALQCGIRGVNTTNFIFWLTHMDILWPRCTLSFKCHIIFPFLHISDTEVDFSAPFGLLQFAAIKVPFGYFNNTPERDKWSRTFLPFQRTICQMVYMSLVPHISHMLEPQQQFTW